MQDKTLKVALNLEVKTYDIDFTGIVSNIVYIRWLEDLRLKMLDTYLPLKELMARECCPIDRPVGRMWMSELGKVRCTLQAEIYLNDEIVTSATQTGFFLDLSKMRPMAIPKELKQIYFQHDH